MGSRFEKAGREEEKTWAPKGELQIPRKGTRQIIRHDRNVRAFWVEMSTGREKGRDCNNKVAGTERKICQTK